jgi:integration host factor subunit alpha
MTKAEIVQALYTRVGGFSKKESADIVDMVFEMMKETLGRGEKIKISGFGNFVLRDKRQRPGRNPQTGDPIKISERRVLTFKASQILKQALNPRSGNGHDDIIEDEDDMDDDDDADETTSAASGEPHQAQDTAAVAPAPAPAPAPVADAAPVPSPSPSSPSAEAPKE